MSDTSYPLPLGCPSPRLREAFRDDLTGYCAVVLYTALVSLTSQETADAFTVAHRGIFAEAGMVMAEELVDGSVWAWEAHVELAVAVMAAVVEDDITGTQ